MNDTNLNLDDRMKHYESQYNIHIPANYYFLIRLDGISFSKFTSGFQKPFDELFIKAMTMTVEDLMNKFNNIVTGYCHSDEITLIFNKCNDKQTHLYNGRIQKLTSVVAGYCSTRFNFNLLQIFSHLTVDKRKNYTDKFITLINLCEQCFDARILSFENIGEITNHQIWRSVHDCERNAINTFAYTEFGHKKLQGISCENMIKMLEEVNIYWNDVPQYIKHGIYCKKILVDKITAYGICKRNEIIKKSFKIEYSDDMNQLLINKYWSDVTGLIMKDVN